MEKAAVPELYRQAMFEPEFLTTVCFYLFFLGGGGNIVYRHEVQPICCRRIQDAPQFGTREEWYLKILRY